MRYSSYLLHFLGQNTDLERVSEDGVMIDFIEGRRALGWIEIAVRIDETTTRAALANAYPLIDEWRKRLTAYQGPWIGGGDNELYERIWIMKHERNWSYGKIAKFLNSRLQSHIQEGRTNAAIALMAAMNIDADDAAAWIEDMQQNLDFHPDLPVTRELVRSRIRYWNDKRDHTFFGPGEISEGGW